MVKKLAGFILCLMVFQTRGYSNITVRFPDDTLYAGTKGSQQFLPVLVDSIGIKDSIGGFQIGFFTDTTRIRLVGAQSDGSVSSSCQVSWGVRYAEPINGMQYINAYQPNDAPLIGSGLLISGIIEVVNDTAGVVPVAFDTIGFTQFTDVAGNEVRVNIRPGSVTFIPTMSLGIESQTDTLMGDNNVITVPVIADNIMGDRIKSVYMHFKSSNSDLSFAGPDSSATMMGELAMNGGNYFAVQNLDGTLSVSASRDSVATGERDSQTVVKLKLVVRGDTNVTAKVIIDSLVVNGFAEPFKIFNDTVIIGNKSVSLNDTGEYNIKILNTGVSEPDVAGTTDYQLYPNPVSGILNISTSANGNLMPYGISLFGEDGNKIALYKAVQGNSSIDLRRYDIPSGAYTVEIYNNNKIFSKRIFFLH